MSSRRSRRRKEKCRREVSFGEEDVLLKPQKKKEEPAFRRRSASGLAASLAAKKLGKRSSGPSTTKKKKSPRVSNRERITSTQMSLVSNALKHITSSKEVGAQNLVSLSTELFEYSKTITIVDDTSYFLNLLKLCSENLLNIEQLDSSLGRNLNRKMLPLEENLEICASDPSEFVSLVVETLMVWKSYFKLSRHSFRGISSELITARSYLANSLESIKNPNEPKIQVGKQYRVPFMEIAHCGFAEVQTGKVTELQRVWIVVAWKTLLWYSNSSTDIIMGHVILENALVKPVGYSECQVNVILPENSITIQTTSAKDADALLIIIDSCILRCRTISSQLVFAATRTNFDLVHCRLMKKEKSIPTSLSDFLCAGDHDKYWRQLKTGEESITQWITKPSRLKSLIDYLYMQPKTVKKKKKRDRKHETKPRVRLGSTLVKSSYKDSQHAFFTLAETTDKQKYLSQQALAALSCEFVMQAIGCHTKVIRHCFKILEFPKPSQIDSFVKVALELVAHHPEILFYYLITYPDSVRHLVAQISNTSILKLLLSLWNCSPHTTVQLNALDQIGKEILALLLNSEYSLVSESFSHMLVFLEVLIRRLHAVKMQTAQGTMRKRRWNPIHFGVNKDRLRGIKVDIEQLLQIETSNEHKNHHNKKVDDLLSALPIKPRGSIPSTGIEPEEKDESDFLLFLNDKQNAVCLVRKSLNALNLQTRVKTVQLLATLVRHTQKRVAMEDIPEFIKQLVRHSGEYFRVLQAIPLDTVGFYRLAIVKLFRWLFTLRNVEFIRKLTKQPVVKLIFEFVFLFPSHVFLLAEIDGMIGSLCSSPSNVSDELLNEAFFEKLEKLYEQQESEKTSFPCVAKICGTIFINQKRLSHRNWGEFACKWNCEVNPRNAAVAALTRTMQLEDHWDDFHFLYSSF